MAVVDCVYNITKGREKKFYNFLNVSLRFFEKEKNVLKT